MTGPPNPPVTLRWLNLRVLAVVALVAAAVALVVGGVTALAVQSEENSALRLNAIYGCDGTNLLRGDARLLVHDLRPTYPNPADLSDWLLRIRDCEETYDQQRIVIVNPDVEYRYLQELAHHHRVAVRDGGRRLVPMP